MTVQQPRFSLTLLTALVIPTLALGCAGEAGNASGAPLATPTTTLAPGFGTAPTPGGVAPGLPTSPVPPQGSMGGGSSGSGGGGTGGAAGGASGDQGGAQNNGGSGGENGTAGQGGMTNGGMTGTGGMGAPLEPQLASGIRLTDIEFNQGVAVPIARDGEPLPEDERRGNADVLIRLVKDRGGLFRVFWEVDAQFEARELEAVLTLTYDDDTEDILRQRRMVDGPSSIETIDGAFHWILDPALVQPDAKYSVAVYEVDATERPEPAAPPRIPLRDSESLGVPDIDMVLDLTMIPVEVNGVAPDLSEANAEKLRQAYHDVYPVSEVILKMRAGLSVNGDGINGVLDAVIRARDMDNPRQGEYYIGLAPVSETGWSGVATGGNIRCAASPMTDDIDWMTVGFAVHETGHTVNMGHTPGCQAGGPNRDWPYEGTKINTQGYGIHQEMLFSSEEFEDYMNYCTPDYVSPFTYMLSYENIQDNANNNRSLRPPGNLLRGFLHGPDKTSWWITQGTYDAPANATAVQLELTDQNGAQTHIVGYAEQNADSTTEVVSVEMPDTLDNIQELRVSVGGRWILIDPQTLDAP